MRRCNTEALAIALCAATVATVAGAQQWQGSATPGVTLHAPSESMSESDVSSWLDQYELIDHKDDSPPWFLDLLHADLGYRRDDETSLFEIERWAPYAWGEHTLLDLDWRGLRVEGEAHRFRTDFLRLYPVGTGDTGATVRPNLGSHWNDGSSPDDRFFVRRYGGGGEIQLRPADFGLEWPLTQLSFSGYQEQRTGQRQDGFLLEPDEVGSGPEAARFRGLTRDLDQEVTTLGSRLVAEPFGLATSLLDFSWQHFAENAPTALVGDIADPNVQPTAEAAQRALFFVPDTNRYTGQLRISKRIGAATVQGGAYASHLVQTGARPPIQRQDELRHNDVNTFSAQAAADVPLTSWLGLDLYGKGALRKNGLGRDTAFFADDNRTQLYPFLKSMVDLRSGAELTAEPMRGARVGLGWRMRDVNRDLEYPQTVASDGIAQHAITPAVSLVGKDSTQQVTYLRGHARLRKRTRVAGEVGFEWAPTTGSPTELEHAFYGEGRISHGLLRPLPITASLFGHYRSGESDGWQLESTFAGRSQTKYYESRNADWGLSVAAVPRRGTSLYLTVTQQLDRQRFPHVRSNVPRPNGAAFLRFFRDSDLGWDSNSRLLAIGGTQQLTRKIDLSLTGWMGFIDARFPRGGSTADALENADQIDLTYGSAEAAIGVQVLPQLRMGLAYQYDAYRDDARLDEPKRDGHDHAVTLSATYDFSLGD